MVSPMGILSDKEAKGDPYRKYSFRVFLEPPKRHAPITHASPPLNTNTNNNYTHDDDEHDDN